MCLGIYFAEEQGIMYAGISIHRAKGGWAPRREREAAAALAESSIDNEEVNNCERCRTAPLLAVSPASYLCLIRCRYAF